MVALLRSAGGHGLEREQALRCGVIQAGAGAPPDALPAGSRRAAPAQLIEFSGIPWASCFGGSLG